MALTLIFTSGRINRRLTLAVQDGLMTAHHPWLDSVLAVFGVPSARFARAEALASREAHAAAFPLFVQAARGGLREAQYRLGRSYLLGLGVPPSIGEALRWLRRAAEAGETAAQTQLAALALQGFSDNGASGLFHNVGRDIDFGHVDYKSAEHWCRQAVAAGSAEAKTLLGFILTAGPEDHRDPAVGEALYSEAAQAGCSRGQLGLATTLLRDGTRESAAESVALLRFAAADGVALAHHLLGMLAESGAAGVVDFVAAAASYKAAAELGHPQAQVRYGFALLLGRGVEANIFDAETWLRRAALKGDGQAAAVVGYLYARDGELPPNYAEAAVWLRRAAEAGHAGAAGMLGRLLLSGTGIPKDISEAAHWLRIAGESGDQAARADLVRLVLMRQVGEDDGIVATGWLQEGAAAGDPAAQFELGLCLAQGIGAERDDQAAFTWVRRAAELGHPEATRMLAELAGRV
jgi:TPR repeat protein